jgi:hypothetical protein
VLQAEAAADDFLLDLGGVALMRKGIARLTATAREFPEVR